jgi:hypothetical protein
VFSFSRITPQIPINVSLLNVGEISPYDKVELGIQLPVGVENKIQHFVKNRYPVSYKNTDTSFVNPFDPSQLDVQLDFWHSGSGTGDNTKYYKRFGFYYEGFGYNVNRGRVQLVKTANNIRVRFTPMEIGEWKCKATVIVRGDTLSSSVFNFKCSPSKQQKKGFLRVSDNQKYFEVGDSVFFPVGQNIPWPGDIWYNGKGTLPHRDYESYHRLINHFKESGGNYYRMLITPWTYDIEFENLGNYSSRMDNAWELDRLIQFSEEKELKIHFNMLLHGVLENPSVYTITNWDWPAYNSSVYGDKACTTRGDKGFCYGRELNLENPVEFFTDEDAKRFYKNKLRYMIARWGYSTSIGVFELLSEINNLGQQANLKFNGKGCPNIGTIAIPYHDNSHSIPKIVLSWQNEMAKYIKNELNHNNHPIAVSYTDQPDIKNGDLSYYSPYVDIATYNAYSYDRNQNKLPRLSNQLNNYRNNKLLISNSSLRKEDTRRAIVLDKPFMLSEIGSGLSACAQSAVWKQSVFLSPFTGLSGVSMPWLNYNDNRDLWRYFKGVNQFMSAVPLNKNDWSSNYFISKSNKAEVYSLQDDKGKISVGVINNRTFNYYTMRDSCSGCYCSKDKVTSSLSELEIVKSSDKENRLRINKLGTFNAYTISWYNPLEVRYIRSKELVKTNLFGQLKLSYPTLMKEELPFVYFKMEKL